MPIFKHNKQDRMIFSVDISISASLQMTHSPKETKKHFTEDSWQWQWKLFASMGGNENDSWRVAMVKILLCSPSFDAAGRPDWHQNPQWDTPSLSIWLQTSKGSHTKNYHVYWWRKICCLSLLWIRANVSLIRIHVTGRGHLDGKSPGPFYTTRLKMSWQETTNVWLWDRAKDTLDICKLVELNSALPATSSNWKKEASKGATSGAVGWSVMILMLMTMISISWAVLDGFAKVIFAQLNVASQKVKLKLGLRRLLRLLVLQSRRGGPK